MTRLSLLLVAALLLYGATVGAQLLVDSQPSESEQAKALVDKALNAIAGVDDYRGTMIKRELFGDELVEETFEFKFARPFKVYVKYLEPHAGREGIYAQQLIRSIDLNTFVVRTTTRCAYTRARFPTSR